jgi:hypothetical protein
LVGIYLNIFSVIILSLIKRIFWKKKLGGFSAFPSKISKLKYFLEALIAKP